MAQLTAFLLGIAFYVAMIFGPGGRSWSWGPALVVLGIALLSALASLWQKRINHGGWLVLAGITTVGWFAWRAATSPVAEFARADGMLLATAVAAFICARTVFSEPKAVAIWTWLMGLSIIANLAIGFYQLENRQFSVLLPKMESLVGITGFFTHYNETANYLVAASSFCGAAALFGKHSVFSRVVWGAVALAGFGGTYFTHSRGGILAAIVAAGVFAILALIAAKQAKARWFAPAAIIVPIFVIGLGGLLIIAWDAAQTARGGEGISELMDNSIRLQILGTAVSTTGNHPWHGGGSRSYSWESNQFISTKNFGSANVLPEFVHNELVQALTDYGILGALLLIMILAAASGHGVWRICTDSDSTRTVAYIAGLAGMAGMLTQSCFSFVFHLLPGTFLLGCCLGMLSVDTLRGKPSRVLHTPTLLTFAGIFASIPLFIYGGKAMQVTRWLWPVYMTAQPSHSEEEQARLLKKSLRVWPSSDLAKDLARLWQNGNRDGALDVNPQSLHAFRQTVKLHPYDAAARVNLANLYSSLGRDLEAETEFTAALAAQGEMEPAFRANYSAALHYFGKGLRLSKGGEIRQGLLAFERASRLIGEANRKSWPWQPALDARANIHQSLAAALEASGDPQAALRECDRVISFGQPSAHYTAAMILSNEAKRIWHKRNPKAALKLFLDAQTRASQASQLPAGVTATAAGEFKSYLDRQIAFLRSAKVEEEE